MILYNYFLILIILLFNFCDYAFTTMLVTHTNQHENVNLTVEVNAPRSQVRIKRDGPTGGAGKYAEASRIPQIKALRLFLQLFKNLWDASYVGGSHPFHPNIPKVFVALYKDKVERFFFPPVGEDPKKAVQT